MKGTYEHSSGLHQGNSFTVNRFKRQLNASYQLGTIQDVQVFAERREGAVKLRFFVEPKRLFGGVEIVGLETLDPDDLRTAISPKRLSEITSQTESDLLKAAGAHLFQAGFRKPSFELQAQKRSTYSGVYYRLFVNEGERQRIDALKFGGTPHYDEASLIPRLASVAQCPTHPKIYASRAHQAHRVLSRPGLSRPEDPHFRAT